MISLRFALSVAVAAVLTVQGAIAQAAESLPSQDDAMKGVEAAARSAEATSNKDNAEEAMRQKAMLDAARNYGVQMGRYTRWMRLQTVTDYAAVELDQGFRFQALYLRNGTLQPPVLDMADEYQAIEDGGRMRKMVEKTYRTLVQARFRNTPLSWRDFLIPEELAPPPMPRDSLLPQGKEKDLWRERMTEGWAEGESMATDEFELRVEALQRAFRGMVLYRLLARHGMIQPPRVVEHRPGEVLTNDSGDRMLIGTREEVVAQDSYFVAEPDRWKPLDYGFVSPVEKSRTGSGK
ncbi:TPA: type IV secretory system conjugative DNA transfer family protein [Pseudomonas aeruginosa]